jgi:hypothetical protein
VVKELLEVDPDRRGAMLRDSVGRLPITIAVEMDRVHFECVQALYQAYPDSIKEKGPGDKLPLHILAESLNPCIRTAGLFFSISSMFRFFL